MLSSAALRAGELLAAALIAAVLLLAVSFAGVLWLRRRVRRRLESLSRVLAGRARGATAGAGTAGWRWLLSRPVPDRRWRSAVRCRRQLWRAVSAAEHAVAVARGGGAPTGELDVLCRRLRQAAGSLDRSLAIDRQATVAGTELPPASSQVTELVSAAGHIQAAAAAVLGSSSRLAASGLAEEVHRETVALAAGMASAASAAAPGRLPRGPG